MKRIENCSTLEYSVNTATTFLFQIAVADNEHQTILEESFETVPACSVEAIKLASGNRMMRLVAEPGPLTVRYRALVDLKQDFVDPHSLCENQNSELPAEVLPFLNPSRYCESDLLAKLAWDEFGQLEPGYNRVNYIVNWVNNLLDYVPGSTGPSTTACDVLIQRQGVCRDYAHLTIALCRALGIPARYLAGYAVDLQPPDFHGFCEVWLGEGWYLFDATRLAPVEGFVRIGTGRDASDVAFATIIGSANSFSSPLVAALPVKTDTPPGKTNNGQSEAVSIG